MANLIYTITKTNDLLEKVNNMPDSVADGKTPVLETGTTTTLSPTESATSEVVRNGSDSNGNPKYKINLGIPKGKDGTGGSGGGVADSVDWSNVLNKPGWVNSTTKPTYTASEVGALPSNTTIPSKTSQLTNDSKFVKDTDLKTINGQSLIGSGNITISGGSGGGSGNVSVSNAAALVTGKKYAFTPSANGVTDGSFSEIANASNDKDGLMSKADYSKLNGLKDGISLPVNITNLSETSSSEDIISLFSLDGVSDAFLIAGMAAMYSNLPSMEYAADVMDIYIGNYKCFVDASYEDSKCSLSLTYVVSGKLKTIKINGTNNGNAWIYSCEIQESGDDTYYLPVALLDLKVGTPSSEIHAAAGGSDEEARIKDAIKARKKIYISKNEPTGNYSIPVSASLVILNYPFLVFDMPKSMAGDGGISKTIRLTPVAECNVSYKRGYRLSLSLYSLTGSSASDDIGTAVGGEAGLKEIIQAAKDGNVFFINGKSDNINYRTDLSVNIFSEDANGDLSISFTGFGYALWEGLGGMMILTYTKSSNTFGVQIMAIS